MLLLLLSCWLEHLLHTHTHTPLVASMPWEYCLGLVACGTWGVKRTPSGAACVIRAAGLSCDAD